MIRKSVFTGIWLGLLLALVMIFPALEIFAGRAVPMLGRSIDSFFGEILLPGFTRISVSVLVLMGLAGIGTMIVLSLGTIAALRSRASSVTSGMLAGTISGLFAGVVFYIIVVSPTATVSVGANVLDYTLHPGNPRFPSEVIVPFAQFILFGVHRFLIITLGGAAAVGGLEGALVGFIRRRHGHTPGAQSLMDCVEMRGGNRVWFRNYEEPVLVGLVTGVIGGILLVVTDFLNQSASLNSSDATSQWINSVFYEAMKGAPIDISKALLPVMLMISFLVMGGMGGVAAFLPKNPPGFLRSRIFAAMVCGTIIGLTVSLPTVGYLCFGLVLLPQLLLTGGPTPDVTEQMISAALASSEVRVLLVYLLPLPVIFFISLAYTLWGVLQGMVYGLIFSLLKIRPVDRARAIRRQILEQGDQFLPRIYTLFQSDCRAVLILEHLAFDLRGEAPRAKVVAAYHTLATQPALAPRALEQITMVLESQPGWKLSGEIQALHRSLGQGLGARTLAQIAALTPLPEKQTSSLPLPLAKAGDYISRPLLEIKKVERVDDLNTKIIFLSNALESLRQARIFCKTTAVEHFCTPLPEIGVLNLLLDQWEAVILGTIRDIQGSADLTAELKTRKVTRAPEMVVCIMLANRGLNVAEKVLVKVDECSEEYIVIEGGEQAIEILSPQETQEINFTIQPKGQAQGDGHLPRSIRVCWSVSYGDALKSDYLLEFGDQLEFMEEEKPFQRIFPIPYVTGTPLQNEQMFVGREDVFAFIREHLLGKYQNNIIVLHGQRRTGKSSVLYHLGSEMADTHFCVLIDMQGKAARGEVDFLYSIADDIVYTLENKGIQVDLPPRKAFEESPEFFFRSRFLRSVYEALGENKNLMLMFDEFEELQKRVEDGKLTADIFPYLRNLMQHERRLDFIFAGTHKLEELAAEYWSILFNIAIYKKITFLEMAEVTRLVTEPVLTYGMEYDPLAIERIYQVTSGHPYFTQVVCHEMVAYHNESRRCYQTVTDVEAALDRILERGEAHFKYIWAESTTEQRLTLMAMAEYLETAEAATIEDIASVLERRGRPLARECLFEALGPLEARDIIERSGPRSSLYHFKVDLIRRWLYAARPSYEKVI